MSTSTMIDPDTGATSTTASRTGLLVCFPTATLEEASLLSETLTSTLRDVDVLFSSPSLEEGNRVVPYPTPPHGDGIWALTAKDYLAASQIAVERDIPTTLVLGAEASSLEPEAFGRMIEAVLRGADLAVPRYLTGPHEALVSAAILGPMTRALYGMQAHTPLPIDACFSRKMAGRLSVVAKKSATATSDPLIWPTAEAALASFSVKEVPVGQRTLPQPEVADLNMLLAQVIGSLFSDAEAKATFWQRARTPVPSEVPSSPASTTESPTDLEEIQTMLEDFRNAYDNLQEIWALVLPPQSLFRIKRISRTTAADFEFPADLWARTLYDFLMAFHLRSINRGHLLGALTPLYLAWVASHLRASQEDTNRAAAHAEATAAAFVTERPYLVSRWRWPDRFNP